MLRSSVFVGRQRMMRVLGYFVEESMQNGHQPIEQRQIAGGGLGLADDFSPSQSAYVRVTLARLRRLIERYYEGPGRNDTVRLGITRGPYRLVVAAADGADADADVMSACEDRRRRPTVLFVEPEVKGAGERHDMLVRGIAVRSASLLVDMHRITVSGPLLRDQIAADGRSVAAVASALGYDYVTETMIRLSGPLWRVRLKVTVTVSGRVVSTAENTFGPFADMEPAIEVVAGGIVRRIAGYFATLPDD